MDSKTIQKYKKASISLLLNKTREIFNEFIRLRDSDENYVFTCISCGRMKQKGQLQAGHYFPAGQNSGVRFNEHNVNGECVHCNYYSGEHLIGYRNNLIKKIGIEKFESLKQFRSISNRCHKWDRFSLIEKIEKYKVKVKKLKLTKNF